MTNETEISSARYRIDARRGSFKVRAFADGLLSFAGHSPTFAVRKYGGEINIDANGADSMLLVARADSLSLLDKMSEKDSAEIENTMRENVLETSRFPEIIFVSKDVSMREISNGRFAVKANGNLSLCGETRPQTIEAEAEIENETIRARGEFVLKQSDFNIKPVKALGGTLKVKDEVNISFEIAAQI
ncbi:MAG: YceI family protein [Pyrinomonadaceae bacterium]